MDEKATKRAPRNIVEVIDCLGALAPELKPLLAPVRASAGFTAPEIMHERWAQASSALAVWARDADPDLVNRLGRIWQGLDAMPCFRTSEMEQSEPDVSLADMIAHNPENESLLQWLRTASVGEQSRDIVTVECVS